MTPRHPRDEDDADPQVSDSRRYRPQEALTDEGAALGEGSRGAWRLLVLIAAVLVGAGTIGATFAALATVQAEKVVAPVEKKLDSHLDGLIGQRKIMELYVQQQTQAVAKLNRKLDALCRASARPAACLNGDDEP